MRDRPSGVIAGTRRRREPLRISALRRSLVVAAALMILAWSASASAARPAAAGEGEDSALAAVVAAGSPAAVPRLGRKGAPSQRGYGEVRPTRIDNGGDPTGLLWRVHWTRWGLARAIGRGFGYFNWPGLGVADGTVPAPAVVIAYDLGTCRGQLSYRKIKWFFPRYGESFITQNYIDICNGGQGPTPSARRCGRVALRSTARQARSIEALGVTCRRARALIAGSPSLRYLRRGGRFRYAGLFCGSEGDTAGQPALFECVRGRVDILYWLRGA
jgi:hypothetical protein